MSSTAKAKRPASLRPRRRNVMGGRFNILETTVYSQEIARNNLVTFVLALVETSALRVRAPRTIRKKRAHRHRDRQSKQPAVAQQFRGGLRAVITEAAAINLQAEHNGAS